MWLKSEEPGVTDVWMPALLLDPALVSQSSPDRQLPAHLLPPNKLSSGPGCRCSIQPPLVLATFQSFLGKVSPGSTCSWRGSKVPAQDAQTSFVFS